MTPFNERVLSFMHRRPPTPPDLLERIDRKKKLKQEREENAAAAINYNYIHAKIRKKRK